MTYERKIVGRYVGVVQSAEATDLKSVQFRFKSEARHQGDMRDFDRFYATPQTVRKSVTAWRDKRFADMAEWSNATVC